jgi:predicted phosphodiesterase
MGRTLSPKELSMTFSRRQMLQISASALLVANFWPGRLWAADVATKPLKFVVLNDLHYIDAKCQPFFEGLVTKINEIDKLDFVIVAGDLVENGTAEQCAAMLGMLKKLKAPFHVTAGNHDPKSQTDRKDWEAAFGKDLNKTFEVNGWQVITFDSSDGTKSGNVAVRKEQLDFLAGLPAKLDKNKPTFLYTHFPLVPTTTNHLTNIDAALAPLKDLNLTAIFGGHFHGFSKGTPLKDKDVIATTNNCCSFKRANHNSTFQKGFFLIEAADGKYTRAFIEYGTDFPSGATPNNRTLPTTRPAQPADKSAPWY